MSKTQEFTDEDMAAVGRALMAAIEVHADAGWHPSDCPSEIVGGLRNQRDELRAELDALKLKRRAAWDVLSQPLPPTVADAFDQA